MPFASASRSRSNISRLRVGKRLKRARGCRWALPPCMAIADRSSPAHTSRACRRIWRKLAVMGAGSAWLRSQIEKARNCVGCARAAGCQISAYKQVATKKPAFHSTKGGLANACSGNQPTLHSNTVMLRGGARNSLAPAGMLSTSSASSVDSASFQCTGSSEEGRVKVTPSW